MKVFFENHTQTIREELAKAQHSVHIAVAWLNFSFFHSTFLELLDKKIKLRIICSDNHSNRRHLAIIRQLQVKGAVIRLLSMPNVRNHMHHKFCIIDRQTILNGSFNWSLNARKSFENLMVIHDASQQSEKFIEEFLRLQQIEKESIKNLQKMVRCKQRMGRKRCEGELLNILVFAEKSGKHYELTGDIVQYCNCCQEYLTIKYYVESQTLPLLLDEYRGSGSAEKEYELYGYIQEELNSHLNSKYNVHAIGRVYHGLDHRGDDELYTGILWKNVFVGDRIPDVIDELNFNVCYDSSSEL